MVPAGQLPVLCIDGRKHCDTIPMLRMLGIKLGIYDAKDPNFTYHCDVVLDKFSDILSAGADAALKKDEEKKKSFCIMLDKLLCLVCDQMKKFNWCYVASNSISPADFILLSLYHNTAMNELCPIKADARKVFEKFPALAKYFKTTSEELKDYLANRK